MLLRFLNFGFLFNGLLDAAGGSGAAAGGAAGASGSPGAAGAGAGTGASATPSSSTAGQDGGAGAGQGSAGAGTGAGQGEPEIADGNWKQLRTQYDAMKGKLGEFEPQAQAYGKIHQAASDLATKLGYPADDFKAAFERDPIRTIEVLRQEAAEAERTGNGTGGNGDGQGNGQDQDLLDRLEELVDQKTAPINEHVNRQMTEAAMTRYNTEVTTAVNANSLVKDAPAEIKSLLTDYLEEYFSAQPEILAAMKVKGDFSAVKAAVDFAAGRLHTAFAKWLEVSRSATGQQDPDQGQDGGGRKKFTLDQIIDDPAVLGDQYAAR